MFNEAAINNPFPGLRPFEEDENILFFGRENQVDELLKKLRTSHFIAVIGSSGSGKSSLVKSGLIPALQSGFMSGAGSSWRICSMRPGNNPIGNMARALVAPGVLSDTEIDHENINLLASICESTLRRSSNGLADVYKEARIPEKENLLILVDQFEELFRFNKFENEIKDGKRDSVAFVNLLLGITHQKELPIYIVFTMRSDFLSDCTEFRGFSEAINEGNYLVPRMTREERREAITGPIAVANASITPGLINQLLNDVGDNPDQLPIMQHALMRTWDIWKQKNKPDEPLSLEDYQKIGTMEKALSMHAEEAYLELKTDGQKKICELLFRALTDKGSDARGIRRPSVLKDIAALANVSIDEVIEVIDVFRKPGRAFLMPSAEVKLTPDSIIDISHESIMRVWKRLMDWLDIENDSAKIYERLSSAAMLYEEGKGGVWRDPELQVAWNWKQEHKPNKAWADRYNQVFEKSMNFLDYSKQQHQLAIKHKEQRQKRRLRQARQFVVIVSLIAIGAVFLAIFAFDAKKTAITEKTKADRARVIADHQKELALKAEKVAQEEKKKADSEKKKAIHQEGIAKQATKESIASLQKALDEQKAKEELELKILESRANIILKVNGCPVTIIQAMNKLLPKHKEWQSRIDQLKNKNTSCRY